jgi:hypothetical protein
MDLNLESGTEKLYHAFNVFTILFTVSALQPGTSSMKIAFLPIEKKFVPQFP